MLKTKLIQKIDNVMGYGFKFLCFAVVFAIILGFASSCFAVPARALTPEDELLSIAVDNYLDIAKNNLDVVQEAIISDMENGDFTAGSSVANQIMSAFAMQTLLYTTYGKMYEPFLLNNDWDSVEANQSVSNSDYAWSGFYRPKYTDQDPLEPRIASLIKVDRVGTFGEYILSGADYDIKLSSNIEDTAITFSFYSGNRYINLTSPTGNRYKLTLTDVKGFLTSSSTSIGGAVSIQFGFSSSTIPIVTEGTACGASPPFSRPILFGYPTQAGLVDGNITKNYPWIYYNERLLPVILETLEGVPNADRYIIFPVGYDPDTSAPIINNNNNVLILPPIIAGAGAIIAVGGIDFNVSVPLDGLMNIDGIQFQVPLNDRSKIVIDGSPFDLPILDLDIDGHNIQMPDINHIVIDGVEFTINVDGSLNIDGTNYPLPIGQPETMPPGVSDYIMYYDIPTLERINIVDATVSKPNLDAYADGMALVWDSVGRILDASGYSAIIPILLAFAALYYLLFKVGGH